jgi:hypothetical protein
VIEAERLWMARASAFDAVVQRRWRLARQGSPDGAGVRALAELPRGARPGDRVLRGTACRQRHDHATR